MLNLITDLGKKYRPVLHFPNRRVGPYDRISKLGRRVFEHKNVKRILGGNIALVFLVSSMTTVSASNLVPEDNYQQTVIPENQVQIKTQAHIQYPLDHVKVNQGYSFLHRGVDLDGEIGDTVKPVMEGTVVEIEHSSFSYGNAVLVQHSEGYSSIYAHLSKIDVELGQKVGLDTKIGEVGTTGHSTGPHLHLEIRINGVQINPFSMLP